MQLTYKFRLYPSRAQEQKLLAMLDQCRWLYNHFLERLNRKENGKTFHQASTGDTPMSYLIVYDIEGWIPQPAEGQQAPAEARCAQVTAFRVGVKRSI
jgi:hypothetical protein